MEADQAAVLFVEICSRLDALVDSQRRTNELLAALEIAFRDHLLARAHERDEARTEAPALRPPGKLQRGLGHLIPYDDDTVYPTAVSAT